MPRFLPMLMLCAGSLVPLAAWSQDAPDPVRQAIASIDKMLEQRPADPTLYYYRASFQARAKEPGNAIASMKKVIELGDGFLPIKDFGFEHLKDNAEFQSLRTGMEKSLPVAVDAPMAFRLPDRQFAAEGIAYDPVGKRFYMGSFSGRGIVRIDPAGAVTPFTRAVDKVPPILGVAVDAGRRLLYAVATTAYMPKQPLYNAVLAYDLKSGKRLAEYKVPEAQQLNDVALAANGELFVSDSRSGAIWRIVPGAEGKVTPFLAGGKIGGTNGLTLTPDGKALYAAHSTGVVRIDTGSAGLEKLAPPPRQSIAAIDGLYWHKGDLIGIQNIVNPGRVIRIRLGKDGASIVAIETLLSHHHPHVDQPTTGAISGDTIHVLATTQIGRLNDKGEFEDAATLKQPAVLKVMLGGNNG